MAQKSATAWASIALLVLFALTRSGSSSSLAQSQQKDRITGDWELMEERYGATGPTGVPDTARTLALNGRTAQVWFTCSTYQVHFKLYPDAAFEAALPENSDGDIVFTRVGPVDYFRRMLLTTTENASVFNTHVGELMAGATFMICPKENDKDPACLTFSLKGITAALKAICPKR